MRMADTAAILNCERVKAVDAFARVCFAHVKMEVLT